MADWRQKVFDISKTKGGSAPESAKRAGMGCLIVIIIIVSILTLVMAIGLIGAGHWVMGGFTLVFFAASAVTCLAMIWPHKPKPL